LRLPSPGCYLPAVQTSPGPPSPAPRFERYVAIGDSTSEGLDDPDGRGGYRGWANRLAERLATLQGSVLYANLAVRGLLARQIRERQLERAVAMRPDLATVVAGMNDLLRPDFDAGQVAGEVEAMQRALIAQGATVLTFTLPDLTPIMPFSKRLAPAVRAYNQALREVSAGAGALLADLAAYPVSSDPRLWSEDRLHANALGHERTAQALAQALGLPGADDSWTLPLPPRTRSAAARMAADLAWGGRYLAPWIWRHLRGRSSGDGRSAKRPELLPFSLE
jgi:lysophospholipase L1-like esterase